MSVAPCLRAVCCHPLGVFPGEITFRVIPEPIQAAWMTEEVQGSTRCPHGRIFLQGWADPPACPRRGLCPVHVHRESAIELEIRTGTMNFVNKGS